MRYFEYGVFSMSKKKDFQIAPESLMDYLEALEDPRIDRTKKHALIDILVVAICAAICGAKSWSNYSRLW